MLNSNLQIAISGHRVLSQANSIKAGLDKIFLQLRASCPGEDWVFHSQLAE